jgi:hypothetical protein
MPNPQHSKRRKRAPTVLTALGKLRSATVARMTDAQLVDLMETAECVQAIACAELARRGPGRAVVMREISVFEKVAEAVQ